MIVDIDYNEDSIAKRTLLTKDLGEIYVLKKFKNGEILQYDGFPICFSCFSDAYRFLYMSEEFKDYSPLKAVFDDKVHYKAINLDGTILYQDKIAIVNDRLYRVIETSEEFPIYCHKVFIDDNDYICLRTHYMYRHDQSEMEIMWPALQAYHAMNALRKMSEASIVSPDEFDRERTFLDGKGFIVGSPLFHVKFMKSGVRRIIYPNVDGVFPWKDDKTINKVQLVELEETNDSEK